MLHFFRRYQKIVFLFTTIVVVLSFVFFGTYQAIAPAIHNSKGGGEEPQSYTMQMSRFLNSEEWMSTKQLFEANFLNDSVISKEFLETGMADLIVASSPERFQKDFEEKLEREKEYQPYTHPYLPTLSANSLWSMFAPDLPVKLKAHQEGKGQFKERCELFLAQKKCPPAFFSQVIRYQERNNPHLPPDPRLAREDNALFAYYDLTDWFGANFVDAISETIISTAQIARKSGYKVTKSELLADLILRSTQVYNAMKDSGQIPANDGYGLFQFYLKQMGMREETALKIWEDVTLFRRLLHAVGDGSGLVDTMATAPFYSFAYENALVETTQLAPEYRFKSMDDLKRFETYLAAVGQKKTSPLSIPLEYDSLEAVEKRAAELVCKRYDLYYTEISKRGLQSKVGVKETLQWECDSENWQKLQKQFPELAQKTGTPFEILEAMDRKGRKLVDTFVRKQIVDAHPEWITVALLQSDLQEKEVFLGTKSDKPFAGITDVARFIADLDKEDELVGYTQDGVHFYRILVNQRDEKQILSYKEALKANVLDKLSGSLKADELVKAVVEACPSRYKTEAFAYRFAKFMDEHKEKAITGTLGAQFQFEKKQRTISRSEPSFIAINDVLNLEVGSSSKVQINTVEGAYFYRFLEKKTDKSVPVEKLILLQELLSKEARLRYFESILSKKV